MDFSWFMLIVGIIGASVFSYGEYKRWRIDKDYEEGKGMEMIFMKTRIICNDCGKDLTLMGKNYTNHLDINEHSGVREEFMMYKK